VSQPNVTQAAATQASVTQGSKAQMAANQLSTTQMLASVAPPTLVSAKKARLLTTLVVLSLGASLLLLLRGPGEVAGRRAAADGYSRSALGHVGMLQWLRANGHSVTQLRTDRNLGECGLLIVAEPNTGLGEDRDRIERWHEQRPPLLLVLPKRDGSDDPTNPGWNDETDLSTEGEAEDVLRAFRPFLGYTPVVQRFERVSGWRTPAGWPVPDLVSPAQLLKRRPELEAIVECSEGVLFGRMGDGHVLADPDLLQNHGLGRGDNAVLLLRIVDELTKKGGLIVDETLHGHLFTPSFWQAMGEFPLVLVTIHLVLLALFVVWVARGRFGPLLAEPPAIGAGKGFLIDNVVALLRGRQHVPNATRRYLRQQVARAAAQLGAGRGLGHERDKEWLLARIGDPRRREELAELLRGTFTEQDASAALAAADRVRSIVTEIVHGSR